MPAPVTVHDLKIQFTAGELDPKLAARRDLKHYHDGAQRMRNVFPLPQGGFRRRHGMPWVADVSTTASAKTPVDGHRWIPFKFSVDDEYMLLFLDEEIRVFKDDGTGWSQVHTITGTPWTGAQCVELDYAQSLETLIVAHKDVKQRQLTRVTDTNWTLTEIEFTYIPHHQFVPSQSNPDATITPSGATGKITLTLVLGAFGGWTTSHINQKVIFDGGVARIMSITSSLIATAAVELPFFNDGGDVVAAGPSRFLDGNEDGTTGVGGWILDEGWEKAWSATRGYPGAVALYQGRVWYGGGRLADTIWGSKINVFIDFEPFIALDDEPITITLAQDTVNAITRMTGGEELTMFTSGGVFSVPQVEDKPITPQNASSTKRRAKRGAAPNVSVPDIDQAVFFVQRGGKTIRELLYDNLTLAYTAEPLSLLAGHLLNVPVDLSVREASSTDESDILFSAQGDGTLASCTMMRSQKVIAWALQSTEGDILGAGVISETIFLLTKRTIDSATVYSAEIFDEDRIMDASLYITTGLPTDTFTVAHLPNTTVHATADGAYMGTFLTNGAGQLTLPRDAETDVEIGLDFPTFLDDDDTVNGTVYPTPYVRTMPLDVPMPDGTIMGRKKRVSEATVSMFETAGLTINGNEVIFREFGEAGGSSPLDAPPPLYSGEKAVEGMLGYDEKGQVEFYQSAPLKMTVLGFAMKVSA